MKSRRAAPGVGPTTVTPEYDEAPEREKKLEGTISPGMRVS
jgi:hypothetical protein